MPTALPTWHIDHLIHPVRHGGPFDLKVPCLQTRSFSHTTPHNYLYLYIYICTYSKCNYKHDILWNICASIEFVSQINTSTCSNRIINIFDCKPTAQTIVNIVTNWCQRHQNSRVWTKTYLNWEILFQTISMTRINSMLPCVVASKYKEITWYYIHIYVQCNHIQWYIMYKVYTGLYLKQIYTNVHEWHKNLHCIHICKKYMHDISANIKWQKN